MIHSGVTVQGRRSCALGEFKPSDRWMLALYTAEADLDLMTRRYTPAGECDGQGYRPGGVPLRNFRIWEDGEDVCMTWDSVTIPNATISARGFMIYNASADCKSMVIGDWGGVYTSTVGPFKIPIATDIVRFASE